MSRRRPWRALGAATAFVISLAPRAGLAQASMMSPAASVGDRWSAAAERFVRALGSGDFGGAASLVSPGVPAGAMSAERLRAIWTQLVAQLGSLSSLEPGARRETAGAHVVDLPAAFANARVTLRVALDADERVVGFFVLPPQAAAYETPAYVDTSAFVETELSIGSGELALPGTLTLPTGTARVPVVVLVHGSGPNDRDETIGGNRPFRDLAWGLASRGVAVLRYDKRTYAHASQLAAPGAAPVTPESEVVDDALLALDVARAQPRVDPARVFLLGHSLGGLLAPEIARRDGRLAGVVLLAAPARPLSVVVADQLSYLRTVGGDAATRAALDSSAAQVARLRRREAAPAERVLGAPASYWYDLDSRDPVRAARDLRLPMLVAQGGRDYQVTTDDFERWRAALGGRREITLGWYPELNHLFMAGTGKATPAEYSTRSGHVAPNVVADIARWITSTHEK